MMQWLAFVAAALAAIPVVNSIVNLAVLRTPSLAETAPSVAILIPARDEAAAIGPCVEAALASVGADIEVIVVDDGSTDGTAAIVRARAAADPRLRLVAAPPPPEGWKGKTHACHLLSTLTDRPRLLFVDADVRLEPGAAARLAGVEADLVSGVPRQILGGWLEMAIIPMINGLLLGYLPMAMMRRSPRVGLGAAVGQMLMARAPAYRASGGHAAVAGSMHDGLQLARLFRRRGFSTDLVDGTYLARCRMYESPAALWRGFSKNATEGMARPLALPVWTVLLAGGQLAPWALAIVLASRGALASPAGVVTLLACAGLLATRIAQAVKCREPWKTVPLHPLGVVLTLVLQWQALIGAAAGRPVTWRGRAYTPRL